MAVLIKPRVQQDSKRAVAKLNWEKAKAKPRPPSAHPYAFATAATPERKKRFALNYARYAAAQARKGQKALPPKQWIESLKAEARSKPKRQNANPPKPAPITRHRLRQRDKPGERPCAFCGRLRELLALTDPRNGETRTFCRARHARWYGIEPNQGKTAQPAGIPRAPEPERQRAPQ